MTREAGAVTGEDRPGDTTGTGVRPEDGPQPTDQTPCYEEAEVDTPDDAPQGAGE